MWPYLALGGFLSSAALIGRVHRPVWLLWSFAFLSIVLFVGLRHHVGMDWNNYLRMISDVENARDLAILLGTTEPLYAVLLAFSAWTGGGMYTANFISAAVTIFGVMYFARRTPEPWLALLAAFPFLIVVIAMSANRQALAVGIIMFAVARWTDLGAVARALIIILAAQFHTSALLFLVFIMLDLKIHKELKFFGALLSAGLAIYLLQSSGADEYYSQAYGIGQATQVQSSGAWIHVAMNALPASLYFLWPRYRPLLFPTALLRNLAFAALATLPLVLVASAAAGRLSIYWFPVSMWVWSALPSTLPPQSRRPIRLLICALMMGLLFGWLSFANSSIAHIPYSNALMVDSGELEIGIVP